MAAVDVSINREQVGYLEKNPEKHIFSYHQNVPEALSLTMALRAESYSFKNRGRVACLMMLCSAWVSA